MDKYPLNLESNSENMPVNVSELLRSISDKVHELETDAKRELYQERNSAGYNAALLQKAQLVQSLPLILADYKARGGIVPEELEDIVFGWSSLASKAIENDSTLRMEVLLTSKSKNNEPNALERLAIEYDASSASEQE